MLGIPVDTGRNGHAPGGIWMRFHGGTGFLYTGDYSTESALYAFDPLPKSRTMLFDCSYGEDDTPLAERLKILAPHLAGDVLLPAPADGRGPDIALHLYRAGKTIRFDDATRAAVRDLTGSARGYLRDGVEADLAQLAETALPPGEPIRRDVRDARRRLAAARPQSWSSNGRTSRSRRSCSPATSRPARPPIGW